MLRPALEAPLRIAASAIWEGGNSSPASVMAACVKKSSILFLSDSGLSSVGYLVWAHYSYREDDKVKVTEEHILNCKAQDLQESTHLEVNEQALRRSVGVVDHQMEIKLLDQQQLILQNLLQDPFLSCLGLL